MGFPGKVAVMVEEVALKEVGDDATPAEPAGVEAEDVSAGASEAEAEGERGSKLSFLFRNSSLLLAFLLCVEGLDLFFIRIEFPLVFLWCPGRKRRWS